MVFIISAPSGSGKTTLTNELMKNVENLEFSISYTTRQPRGSERNGREYFFVSHSTFEGMLAKDEFLEHASVFGEYYGTARRFLDDAAARGKDLLLDIDVQGAAQVKSRMPEAVSIFILPPSRRELEQRLRRRSQAEKNVAEEVIERRLQAAAREIEKYSKYDYILVNDQLGKSIDELEAIVEAERLKHSGAKPSPEDQPKLATAESCLLPNARERVSSILSSFAPTAISSGREQL
ncbi:MAG TPA: guanylate kinase [Bryobacteraceae bacterium]